MPDESNRPNEPNGAYRSYGAYGFGLGEDEVLVLVEEDFFAATHFLYN